MANEGVAPPDYSTSVGQFRALIGDTEATNIVAGSGEYMWYGDDHIDGLLTAFADNTLRAAAQALRTIASSQALLLKKWSSDDLTVDGAAIADQLRRIAQAMDIQAGVAENNTDFVVISNFPQQIVRHEYAESVLADLFPDFYEQNGGLLLE